MLDEVDPFETEILVSSPCPVDVTPKSVVFWGSEGLLARTEVDFEIARIVESDSLSFVGSVLDEVGLVSFASKGLASGLDDVKDKTPVRTAPLVSEASLLGGELEVEVKTAPFVTSVECFDRGDRPVSPESDALISVVFGEPTVVAVTSFELVAFGISFCKLSDLDEVVES
jgi:hypothetical protein